MEWNLFEMTSLTISIYETHFTEFAISGSCLQAKKPPTKSGRQLRVHKQNGDSAGHKEGWVKRFNRDMERRQTKAGIKLKMTQ